MVAGIVYSYVALWLWQSHVNVSWFFSPYAAAALFSAPMQVIRAPLPGIYLDRHPLRSQPLAAVGSEVAASTSLALLQVGPLLISVPAPDDGMVVEKFAEHGATVGYGAPLIGLQPHGSDVG